MGKLNPNEPHVLKTWYVVCYRQRSVHLYGHVTTALGWAAHSIICNIFAHGTRIRNPPLGGMSLSTYRWQHYYQKLQFETQCSMQPDSQAEWRFNAMPPPLQDQCKVCLDLQMAAHFRSCSLKLRLQLRSWS